jgi:A/G-specific adenine glycosylase
MSNISKLLKEVETYYKKEGRSHLPWRKTKDPYKILVSEVMLQQTQVDRVLPFYKNFLKAFPTVQALAKAPLSKVLKAWQGLGYNRRGKFLQLTAQAIVKTHAGRFPKTVSALQDLPGIGPYTAGAIATFAYNQPEIFIETNIRTVFLYFCFNPKISRTVLDTDISDRDILPLVGEALQKTKLEPREFYAALMDYGSYLKKQGIKLNKQSKHYVKQSKFEGSARQLRGAILRELLKKSQTLSQLTKNLSRSAKEVSVELKRLQAEGFVGRRRETYAILT